MSGDVHVRFCERLGVRFPRATHRNVYVRSRRAGERVLETLRRLYGKLRLRVNEEKSAVARVWDRQFLGFSFWVAKGGQVRRRVAPRALGEFKQRVRWITRRIGGRSMAQVAERLRSYLLGWKEYFRLADTPGVFRDLDQWVRRRLRALQLRQWKRGRTVYRALVARGVSEYRVRVAARYARSWWHVAAHETLQRAMPVLHFDALGVPRLVPH